MFERVAIIGLGLLGGSIGLALHRAKAAREIVGYDVGKGVGERARVIGAIDRSCASLTETVQETEIVILATPVGAMYPLLRNIGSLVSPGTIVTDVASTKAQVVAWAEEFLPSTVPFIGGHPMTGKEVSGVEVADAMLFHNCLYCLTPTAKTQPAALNKVVALVEVLNARVWYLEPEEHDKQVASVSHLPFIASTALMLSASEGTTWSEAAFLTAGGFRDMTRLAGGNPEMYRDICLTNKDAIGSLLDEYIHKLEQMRDDLNHQDKKKLHETFERAQKARLQWQSLRDFPEQS